jgi:hypothetical protein
MMSFAGTRHVPATGRASAAQLTAISGSVAAQRRSIEALKTQLSSFDEQLAVLEQILSPLTEWSRTWAEVEERLTRSGRQRTLTDEDMPRGYALYTTAPCLAIRT